MVARTSRARASDHAAAKRRLKPEQARDLAEREIGCCSFFDFTFDTTVGGDVRLTVPVPAAHVEVLDALAQRAAAAAGLEAR